MVATGVISARVSGVAPSIADVLSSTSSKPPEVHSINRQGWSWLLRWDAWCWRLT